MKGFSACVLVVLLACCVTWGNGKRISTKDIMKFFETYDTNEPPRLDGPTEVRIGVYTNNLLFDNEKGIMRMGIYQRMAWQDERLKRIFNESESDQKIVDFDDQMIKRTWRPDLFIRNAVKSEKVDALMTEHLFRVNRTGHTWYVIKIINDVYCPQLLSAHPTIECPIMFESFSYTMDTLYLAWLQSPFDVDHAITLPTRTLKDVVLYDCSQNYTPGAFPCLEVRLMMKRDPFETTFDRGVYLVSAILVIISWLGFWMPPSEKRIFLGLLITLILTMLYTGVAEWREFSCSDCTKGAQIWLIFCLIMVLGMVLEFAVVYMVFGTLCIRLRELCGKSELLEDKEPKRSRCGDIIDTVSGLVIFPAIFIITLIVIATTTFAFR